MKRWASPDPPPWKPWLDEQLQILLGSTSQVLYPSMAVRKSRTAVPCWSARWLVGVVKTISLLLDGEKAEWEDWMSLPAWTNPCLNDIQGVSKLKQTTIGASLVAFRQRNDATSIASIIQRLPPRAQSLAKASFVQRRLPHAATLILADVPLMDYRSSKGRRYLQRGSLQYKSYEGKPALGPTSLLWKMIWRPQVNVSKAYPHWL